MNTRPTPKASGASQPLKTRFVDYMKVYTDSVEPLEMPQPGGGGSGSSAGIGAVRTAFKRSARYNDKKTTIAAPKAAQ